MSTPLYQSVVFGYMRKHMSKNSISEPIKNDVLYKIRQIRKHYKCPQFPMPRCPALRALHGKTILEISRQGDIYSSLPSWCQELIANSFLTLEGELIVKSNGQKLKLTKWLSNIGINELHIQDVATALKSNSHTLTLSTSHRDLLRCSITKHFTSCWCDTNVFELLALENYAILLCKDSSGDIIKRWICYWSYELIGLVLYPYCYPDKRFSCSTTVHKFVDFPVYRTDSYKTEKSFSWPEHLKTPYEHFLYSEFKDKKSEFLTPIC